MNREVHAPFWERLEVQFLRPTQHRLHWSLDVVFGEDDARIRKDNGPQNVSLLSKIALNLLRMDQAHSKLSLRQRRKAAGWDDDARMQMLGLRPLG